MEKVLEILNGVLSTQSTPEVQGYTSQVNQIMASTEGVKYMLAIILNENDENVRVLASVIIRRHLSRQNWKNISSLERRQIKENILTTAMVADSKKLVKSVTYLMGAFLELEKDNVWTCQILTNIWNQLYSQNERQNERGSYVLACLSDIAPTLIIRKAPSQFTEYIEKALLFATTQNVYCTPCLTHVYDAMVKIIAASRVETEFNNFFCQKLLTILTVLFNLRKEESIFENAIRVLDGLIESPSIDKFIPNLQDFCLQIIGDVNLSDTVRDRVLNVLECLVQVKSCKNLNLEAIMETMFLIMVSDTNPNANWNYETWNDNNGRNLFFYAMNMMESIAEQLNSNTIGAIFKDFFSKALESKSFPAISLLRTYYCFLGTITFECSDFISENLEVFLKMILNGLHSSNPYLSNSALFALKRCAYFIVPDIRKYAGLCIRSLLKLLNHLTNSHKGMKNYSQISTLFSTLKNFLQMIKEKELSDLPLLLNEVMFTMETCNSVEITCGCFSITSCIIEAASTRIGPYVPQLLQILQVYIPKLSASGQAPFDEKSLGVAISALDVLCDILQSSAVDLESYIGETLAYASHLINDEEAIKNFIAAVIRLIGSASFVAKDRIAPILPVSINRITQILEVPRSSHENFTSGSECKVAPENMMTEGNDNASDGSSTESISSNDGDNEESDSDFDYEEENYEYNSDTDMDNEDDLSGLGDIAADEEKEIALIAVKNLANNSPLAMAPYCEALHKSIFHLLKAKRRDASIVVSCIETACSLLASYPSNSATNFSPDIFQVYIKQLALQAHTNVDSSIVIPSLEGLEKIFVLLQKYNLDAKQFESIIGTTLTKLFKEKTNCQKLFHIYSNTSDYERNLMQNIYLGALKLLAKISTVMKPEDFRRIYNECFPVLIEFFKAAKTRKDYVRLLAEGLSVMNDCMGLLRVLEPSDVADLLPLLYDGLASDWCLARENSLHCLGTLVLCRGSCPNMPHQEIVAKLYSYGNEFGKTDGYATLCGCFAKIALVKPNSVNIDSILDLVLQNMAALDFESDYEWIFKYFMLILSPPYNKENFIEEIVLKTLDILYIKKTLSSSTLEAGKGLLGHLHRRDQIKFNQIIASRPEAIESMKALMKF